MKCLHISKIFNENLDNEVIALKDINLEFDKNGLVFIVGNSGSGKSTLLNILAGLDKVTDGQLLDGEIEISSCNEEELNVYRRNNVGFIFQNYNLINEISVRDNVELCMSNRTDNEIDVNYLMKKLNILDKMDEKPINLSGGQQQRISIARALYNDSKVIFADEPTGNLDKENSKNVFEILKNISEKCLVIVVTHDIENSEKYADRIITLEDGKVIKDTNSCKEDKLNLNMQPCYFKHNKVTFKKISKKFIKKKKKGFIASLILLALLLSILGVFFEVFSFNFNDVIKSYINENHIKSVGICKGFTNTNTNQFNFGPRPLGEDTMDEVNEQFDDLDKFYELNGMYIGFGSTGSDFLYNKVENAVVSDENNIGMYELSVMYGNYPQSKNEIAITDYLAYTISILKPDTITKILGISNVSEIDSEEKMLKCLKNLDEQKLKTLFGEEWESEIEDKETLSYIMSNMWILLVNEKIDFFSGEFTVSSILKSDFYKYKDLIYMSEKEIYDNDNVDEFRYDIAVIYDNFFVNEDFIQNCYDKGIIVFDDAANISQTFYNDLFDTDISLENDEVYMSSNYFRDYFGEEFDVINKGNYVFETESSITYGDGGPRDVYYSARKLKVVGVVDIPVNYQNVFASEQIVMLSDNYFKEYSVNQNYVWMLYGDISDFNLVMISDLLEKIDKNELYYYSENSNGLYQLNNIMDIFKPIFKILGLIILIISGGVIFNFFSNNVKTHSHEIGIMKAMGFSNKNIKKIFFYIAFYMITIAIVLFGIIFTVAVNFVDGILKKKYLQYADLADIKNITILPLHFGIYGIVIGFLIVISLVAILLSMFKLNCVKVIDNIRSEQ